MLSNKARLRIRRNRWKHKERWRLSRLFGAIVARHLLVDTGPSSGFNWASTRGDEFGQAFYPTLNVHGPGFIEMAPVWKGSPDIPEIPPESLTLEVIDPLIYSEKGPTEPQVAEETWLAHSNPHIAMGKPTSNNVPLFWGSRDFAGETNHAQQTSEGTDPE